MSRKESRVEDERHRLLVQRVHKGSSGGSGKEAARGSRTGHDRMDVNEEREKNVNGVVHQRALQVLVALTICAGFMVGLQSEAKADYQFGSGASTGKQHGGPDSNGYVPEYYGLTDTCYDQILGRDRYYYDYQASYGPLVHYIYYDSCEMNRLGATSAGWSRLYSHERAHSRGFAHWEGAPWYNASYYPKVDVT